MDAAEPSLAHPIHAASTGAPSPVALLRGLAGYAALGVVGTLGGDDALAGSPVALVTAGGMLLLTVPALLVAHQYLRLAAPPTAILAALARTFARCGDVALGAVPAVLLFTATSALGGPMVALLLGGIALLGFALAVGRLARAETLAHGGPARMGLLAVAWCGLSALVGLRLFATFAAHLL